MTSLAYHLRQNKAADRLAFVESVRLLERLHEDGLAGYTYHALGGPFLEDFRLMYELCPEVAMVSVERDDDVYRRQRFHLPSSKVQLIQDEFSSYITQYDNKGDKDIFWLDFTDLEYKNIEEFKMVLQKGTPSSMVKVSLRCNPSDYWDANDSDWSSQRFLEFRESFGGVWPREVSAIPKRMEDFARLLQQMLRISVQQAFPAPTRDRFFQPVSSFYYRDSTGMFTLTGVVCDAELTEKVLAVYGDWTFANLDWDAPTKIDIPALSTKERLLLQQWLPMSNGAAQFILDRLGYKITPKLSDSMTALEQYAAFHRYAPYLMKAVP